MSTPSPLPPAILEDADRLGDLFSAIALFVFREHTAEDAVARVKARRVPDELAAYASMLVDHAGLHAAVLGSDNELVDACLPVRLFWICEAQFTAEALDHARRRARAYIERVIEEEDATSGELGGDAGSYGED